jgi:hypothetical protein
MQDSRRCGAGDVNGRKVFCNRMFAFWDAARASAILVMSFFRLVFLVEMRNRSGFFFDLGHFHFRFLSTVSQYT